MKAYSSKSVEKKLTHQASVVDIQPLGTRDEGAYISASAL
jgi:hypothetical protein